MSDAATRASGDVLIVDDNFRNLRVLEDTLRRQGYKVRAVRDGATALRVVDSAPPELILLDVRMPGMDGYQVCQALQSKPETAEIPVIFLSAIDELANKLNAFSCGGVDYVTKPFQTEELLMRVQTHLGMRRLQRQLSRSNRELREQTRAAQRSSEEKSRFLAAASHDFRQPLHALLLFLDALENRIQEPQQARPVVTKMREVIDGMDELFSGIFDTSRLDAGTIKPIISNVDLDVLLARLDSEYAPQAAAKGLRWYCDRGNESDFRYVRSDPLLLQRILRNLLSNALRYTESGAIELTTEAVVDESDARVCITVSDTGPGIPPQQQAQVFDEFFRLERADVVDSHGLGLGLGLSIVRRFCRLLDHRLTLESQPQQRPGSRFALSLAVGFGMPSELGDSDSSSKQPFDSEPVEAAVLLIENNGLIEFATRLLLKQWGYQVRSASSESAAKALLRSGWQPQLVISDYRLGGGAHGVDAVRAVRAELNEDLPAVLICAEAEPAGVTEEDGVLVLQKPVKPARLRSVLRFYTNNCSSAS